MSERNVIAEDARIEEIISAIKAYDPLAIARVTRDTYEGEDLYVYVYTDQDSVDLLRHVAEATVRLSEEEDFHVTVLPMKMGDLDSVR